MKDKLKEDKKIETDPFTYLKSYFKEYYTTQKVVEFVDISINDFIKNKEKYATEGDYEKVKNEKIESLDDLVRLGIKQFSNIDLVELAKYITKLSVIWTMVKSFDNKPISLKNINQPEFISNNLKYWWCITMNPQDGGVTGGEKKEYTSLNENNVSNEKILFCLSIASILLTTFYKTISKLYEEKSESKKTITDLINSLCENGLKYFNSGAKISILENIYNNFNKENVYDFYPKLYVNPNIERNTPFMDFIIHPNTCPDASYLGKIYKDYLNAPVSKENKTLKYPDLKPAYNQIKNIFDYCKKKLTALGNYNSGKINQSSGWTDTTLTRIERINNTLKEVNNSSNYSTGRTPLSAGWTDTTLTRIERINNTLKEVNNSSNYSTGRINPSLLRVMGKTKNSGSNFSSGWTDTTLARIERINNTLHNYI